MSETIRIVLSALLISVLVLSDVCADQSIITEVEGYSCTGKKKLTKKAQKAALENSKKKAREYALSYIKGDKPGLEEHVIEAYSRAHIKILHSKDLGWYKEKKSGNCFKVSILAEVIPDKKAMERVTADTQLPENPAGPLHIQFWTDKKEYENGEKIKIYFKGNKSFYARVLYKDTKKILSQLLPNPYRQDNYFNADTVYEIPSDTDKFELEAMPPFVEENIIMYASMAQLGDLDLETRGSVYRIKTTEKDIGDKTRKIKLKDNSDGNTALSSEFFEKNIIIKIKGKETQESPKEPSGEDSHYD